MPRPLTLAVVADAEADAVRTLASVPATRRYVVRRAASAPPLGVDGVVVADGPDRLAAARAVHQAEPESLVVVLEAGERPSAELVEALVALTAADGRGVHGAPAIQPFLGRAIALGVVPIAWSGSPEAGPPAVLAGELVREPRDVTAMIAWVDQRASRYRGTPESVGVADFTSRPAAALLRRLWRRRADATPGLILSILETYGEVLRAAKTWEGGLPSAGAGLPPGFTRVEMPRRSVIVRRDVADGLLGPVLAASPDAVEGEPLDRGGRGATWLLPLRGGGRAVLRWYRRGGLLRHVTRDRYVGGRPRPLGELVLTEEARRRGVPVPEVLAARVDRLRGGTYRGALVTRELPDVETLSEVLRRPPAAPERDRVLAAIGRTIASLHAAGIDHRDLNAGNLLVQRGAEPIVHVIDFDRARLLPSVPPRVRRRALRRLDRSLRKLGDAGVGASAVVRRAYAEAAR